VAEKFGAWREKNMYGKKSMGIARSTFLIDAEGVIQRVWKAVKVDGHDAAASDGTSSDLISAARTLPTAVSSSRSRSRRTSNLLLTSFLRSRVRAG
jgi:hypothetical protein